MRAEYLTTDFVFLRLDAYPHVPYDELTAAIQSVFPDAVLYGAYVQNEWMHARYVTVSAEHFAKAFDVVLTYDEEKGRWDNYETIMLPKSLDTLLIRMAFDAPKPVIPKR